MGLLQRIFGGGAPAEGDYAAELERVKREAESVRAQRKALEPSSSKDTAKVIGWYRKRIELIQDAKYHPVARLQAVPSPAYKDTLDAYCGALGKLIENPTDAAAWKMRGTMLADASRAIEKELPRMQAKLAELEQRGAA